MRIFFCSIIIFLFASCNVSSGTKEDAIKYHWQGVEKFARQDYDSAIYYLDLAIEIYPDYGSAHSNKSLALMQQDHLESALIEAKLAIKSENAHVTYYTLEAMIYERLSQHAKAKNSLGKAVAIYDTMTPTSEDYSFLVDRALCVAFSKNKNEAIRDLNELITKYESGHTIEFAHKVINELQVTNATTFYEYIDNANEKGTTLCYYSRKTTEEIEKELLSFGVNISGSSTSNTNDSLIEFRIRDVFREKAIEFGLIECK